MPGRSYRRRESGNPLSRFFRRPAVQLGILGVAALVVVLIILIGSGQPQAAPSTISLGATISVDEAYKLYQAGGAFFLDVREQSEWAEYHAPDSKLIPLGELPARVNEVPKDQPIVVVCRSGNRSDAGRDILLQAGFTNVTSMDGGLSTWRDKGYPVEP
jgi:rhodanese-related sulfurtransferase